ncbi:hypothetical protein PAXRUDRAFT_828617 [Paxillus rubicundulus Ve08.2h10]|uniref:Secreted protein n=1 Tax=Paxillus rubicundulus Ve08.2h10 TaxID=930991 RepID=A0A0D0DVW7_9AGAM|nr:hypothetical protein PAXRUDRAFT_828617 [Paxillus rubicundulus Ve08.2h10]
MKTFLTLLAGIISLSAYTLLGVHAKCAICPYTVNAQTLVGSCPTDHKYTACRYGNGVVPKYNCFYKPNGARDADSDSACPDNTNTGNDCQCITYL